MAPKVFVSGSFDILHSGHVEFFYEAAQYGDLYVALGSDRTIFELKGRSTVNSEQERLFMVKSVSFVKDAFISRGSGILNCVR
jgi:cytidyltransferase-like protein